jgi:hypothetical protein
LYKKLVRRVNYDHYNRPDNIDKLMNELPYKMKMELLMAIHSDTYETVTFFKGKNPVFFAWIVYLLRPIHTHEYQYIYREGEQISEIFFLT